MTFLTSSLAIAGACAIAIPIIIHLLFRQRRTPIEWGAMRFLMEAFRRHKKRLRLEQWLLLAVRCLIPLLLGLALAQPLLQSAILATSTGNRAVYLIIDNGIASGVTLEDGRTALQHHIEQARQFVNELSAGDAIGVITAARPARGLLVPPSTDHGSVNDLLRSLESEQSATDLPAAFSLARSALEAAADQREAVVYVLSEFRTGSAALDSPPPASLLDRQNVRLLAAPAAAATVSNIQITIIEPVRSVILPSAADGSGQINVRLARTGAQLPTEVTRVRLSGDGLSALEPALVNWAPGQAEASAEFHAMVNAAGDGQIGLTASIDNDALAADNQRFVSLDARRRIRVLLIDRRSFGFERSLDQLSAGQWLRRALEPMTSSAQSSGGGTMEVVEVEPAALDLADIRTADAAILPRPDLVNDNGWNILKGFVGNRGLLIVMPPAEVNIHQWTETFDRVMGFSWQIARESLPSQEGLALAEAQPASDVLRLISSELPELTRPVLVHRLLPVDQQALAGGQARPLLVLGDGRPLLVAGTPMAEQGDVAGRGLVMYLAAAPELSWTSLPSKPLMVPLFQELLRQGLGAIRSGQTYTTGDTPTIVAGIAASDVLSPSGERIALDRHGRPQRELRSAGLFDLTDASGQHVGQVAVNVEPLAARTEAQSQSAVSAWLAHAGNFQVLSSDNLTATVADQSNASALAGVLLVAVLGLVLLETILARLFSHARIGAEAPGSAGGRNPDQPRPTTMYSSRETLLKSQAMP